MVRKPGPRAKARSNAPTQRVLHWDEIPSWMQIDPYIRNGYRRQLNSLTACFWSLFYLHNDFVNTWSHLLPAILWITALVGVEMELFSYNSHVGAGQIVERESVVMVQYYVVGTLILLLASAFFHMTAAHSEAMSKRLLKLDYVGIAFGICATNMSSTYFGLHDKPWWLMFYNTFCVIAGVALLVSLMSPNADGPKAALVRVFTFMALMASGFAPILHFYLVEGSEGVRPFPFWHTVAMELWYSAGTFFYLTHWPEKQFPETFDIFVGVLSGASHQIFHILVAIGQFVFFLGLRERLVMPIA
ncbi:MAG: hypothetical protein ALECFALPRED_001373, partial [Alectoria fallacina]